MTASLADAVGTFEIAGKKVARLGFGAMRLTGLGVWGEPEDRQECVRVVRRAVELGVQLIDTADSYGPHVSEEIIREAIRPYRDDVLIATKAGLTRNGPDVIRSDAGLVRLGPAAWPPVGRPEYLRQQALMSLRSMSHCPRKPRRGSPDYPPRTGPCSRRTRAGHTSTAERRHWSTSQPTPTSCPDETDTPPDTMRPVRTSGCVSAPASGILDRDDRSVTRSLAEMET